MADRSRRRLGRWRRPRWRDPAFWVAVGLTLALIGLEVLFATERSSPAGITRLVVLAVITWIVISACIRIRVGMTRGLIEGFSEVQEKADASPTGRTAGEQVARGAGRAVGSALGSWQRTRQDRSR